MTHLVEEGGHRVGVRQAGEGIDLVFSTVRNPVAILLMDAAGPELRRYENEQAAQGAAVAVISAVREGAFVFQGERVDGGSRFATSPGYGESTTFGLQPGSYFLTLEPEGGESLSSGNTGLTSGRSFRSSMRTPRRRESTI